MNHPFSCGVPLGNLRRNLARACSANSRMITFMPRAKILATSAGENGAYCYRAYSTPSRLDRYQHTVSSLRPENLRSSDFVDLSRHRQARVYFNSAPQPIILYYDRSTAAQPFPRSARGYLYYRSPPEHAHPLSGSLRLRIYSNSTLGDDLLLSNGLPWQILLPQMILHKQYSSLLQQLLEDKLVTPETVAHGQRLFGHRSILTPNHLIFSLDQPFYLPMNQAELRLTIVGREKLGVFVKQQLFRDPKAPMFGPRGTKALSAPHYPYKGGILVRFELSPEGTHILIRVVQIMAPLWGYREYVLKGRIIKPCVGEFLAYRVRGEPTPWSLDIASRSSTSDALRLLINP
ncbi:hypothetical protein DFH06DRAFT_138953 [Mycena polygramma]|nr:hypothetical protein DFH06DRAFT_138953 [Mycena polygramma]